MLEGMKILLLGGGAGPEREVSLRSAAAIRDGLDDLGYDVVVADPADGDSAVKQAAAQCDVILPILHGVGGEDGSLQKVLDETGKPYLGSGVAVSELCFDKERLKDLLRRNDILTPKSAVVTAASFNKSDLIRAPFVLKPIADGSSMGMMIVRELPFDADKAAELLARYGKMLLEELIVGIEITVGVLGDKALPVIEIVPPTGGEFDYENKYNGDTKELCPPQNVSAELQEQAQRLAERIHTLAGARHLSRTDMMIDKAGTIYVLEINTLPGMTSQSLFPKSAAAAGISWPKLVAKFVEMAGAND
jgi:D-alanine-D-alanine ligase